jgi:hypothetical protein
MRHISNPIVSITTANLYLLTADQRPINWSTVTSWVNMDNALDGRERLAGD